MPPAPSSSRISKRPRRDPGAGIDLSRRVGEEDGRHMLLVDLWVPLSGAIHHGVATLPRTCFPFLYVGTTSIGFGRRHRRFTDRGITSQSENFLFRSGPMMEAL